MEGATGGVHQEMLRDAPPLPHLSSHPKHTPHSDLCMSDKAKCFNLPPPRNIRYTSSKRCKIARKVKDGQRKGKVFCEFTFDNKEKLDRGRKR